MGMALNNDKLDGPWKDGSRFRTRYGPCEMKLAVARIMISMLTSPLLPIRVCLIQVHSFPFHSGTSPFIQSLRY